MESFFLDYLDRLEALHSEVEKALEGLPQAGLDWSPGKGMNSIAVLIVHLTGAERYWVGDVASGDPSGRQFAYTRLQEGASRAVTGHTPDRSEREGSRTWTRGRCGHGACLVSRRLPMSSGPSHLVLTS